MKGFPNAVLLVLATAILLAGCKKEEEMNSVRSCDSPVETLVTSSGVEFVRTPEGCFQDLTDWPYEYKYVEIDGLRQAYAEAGPANGDVILLLHGQPSWSYLYRKMIPVLADAGYRVIAMDHLGMGRSDKPVDITSYSYLGHCQRLEQFIQSLGLNNINVFVQDWGSLIGLRVVGLNPDWFATITIGNGDLLVIPEGFQPFPPVENPNDIEEIPYPFSIFPDQQFSFFNGCDLISGGGGGQQEGFGDWISYCLKGSSFHASQVLESLTWFPISPEVEAAYDAPFPSREYMAGVRVFPSLINDMPGMNDEAWAGLTSFEKPVITIWGGNDVGNLGSCETQQKLIANIPGAAGQDHVRLEEAGHFLQSDQGVEIANRMIDFLSPITEEEQLGFELVQVNSPNELIVWLGTDITSEEFDALSLPSDWIKNQPRETDPDGGSFSRSPDALVEGDFTDEQHFGYSWRHNATIVDMDVDLPDDNDLLSGRSIAKFHNVSFNAWSILSILTDPNGNRYVRISRDANRTQENPTIPSSWQLTQEVITEDIIDYQLPNPTLNIRADNEDSWQGPITF